MGGQLGSILCRHQIGSLDEDIAVNFFYCKYGTITITFFLLAGSDKMKLLGVDFDGCSSLHMNHHQLQSVAGTATWLTPYGPIACERRHVIEWLVRKFFDVDICCNISWTFPAHTAG
jgi:hypothetical protein